MSTCQEVKVSGLFASVTFLAAALGAGAAGASRDAASQVAAINPRCNGQVASMLEHRIRADDRARYGPSLDALDDRQVELDSVLQQAQLESDILHNVCTDEELTPHQDHLVGIVAWAYALEADIAPQRYTLLHCPQTAAQAPEALLASAWYAIATTLQPIDPSNPTTAPTPAPLVREAIPKVQLRAAAIHAILPQPVQATEYWRNTELAKVANCPPSTPTPTP